MKKMFFLILLVLVVFSLNAKSVFVKVRICPIFKEANPGSERISVVQQGESLTILADNGDWLKVQSTKGTGYVQKIFTGDTPSIDRRSRADSSVDLSDITTRKRASYYSSSAAATRGLSSESVRDRENVAFKDYDFESIRWVEKFSYTDEELLDFAKEEKLGF